MTEQYLIDEYNLIENTWIESEEDIKDYFIDNGREYLKCDDGSYDSYTYVICKIKNKFYSVEIEGELIKLRQDIGADIYRIDEITNVTWEEIDKPLPKVKSNVIYNLVMNSDQQEQLEDYIKELKIIKL